MEKEKLKVGVLISGRGTNLQALIDACADNDFPAQIVLVVSNVADAYGLKRATDAGIPTAFIDHKAYPTREHFDAVIDSALRESGVEFVCLAGFMRILSEEFVEHWRNRLINIHPVPAARLQGTGYPPARHRRRRHDHRLHGPFRPSGDG